MGVPSGGGQQLGQATGSIVINTSQLAQAQQQVQAASRAMTGAMNTLGVSLGLVGVVQMGRAALSAAQLATAYQRQRVAAESLAGGQAQLNALLDTYNDAMGGSIDKATALANTTQLMAVGFADNTEEIDKFARAIRGISIAMGRSQDFVTQNLILELFSQRGMRLDQIGLQYDLVRQRVEELRAADRGLTQQMAYQQAVLEQAQTRFGALADSAQGQRTEVEKLTDAWKDLRLEMGRALQGPTEGGAGFFRSILDFFQQRIKGTNDLLDQYEAEWMTRFGQRTSIGRVTPTRMQPAARFDPDQLAAIAEWSRGVQEIERQAARARLDATRQFEQQRADTERQYQKSIGREAQDFALSRARAEEDYALGLQRTQRDIAQREARQLEDLERTIADARTEAAERGAQRQEALNERIAETRAAGQERLAELEADFNKRRERSQRDHQESLLDAAGRLDAVAVYRQQRDFAKRQRDELEDFNERLEKERKNEAKRLEELNKAHAKQTADEGKALDKRIRQANDAYQRQLQDARAADEQRRTDMVADFQLRKEREDEDRALRLARMAEDHRDQMDEMARQHALNMARIDEEEKEELARHNEAFGDQMASLNIYHAGVLERQEAHQAESLRLYEAYLEAQRNALLGVLGMVQGGGSHPSLADPYASRPMLPGSYITPAPRSTTNSSRTINIAPGAITITPPANMALDQRFAAFILTVLANFFEGQPQ